MKLNVYYTKLNFHLVRKFDPISNLNLILVFCAATIYYTIFFHFLHTMGNFVSIKSILVNNYLGSIFQYLSLLFNDPRIPK